MDGALASFLSGFCDRQSNPGAPFGIDRPDGAATAKRRHRERSDGKGRRIAQRRHSHGGASAIFGAGLLGDQHGCDRAVGRRVEGDALYIFCEQGSSFRRSGRDRVSSEGATLRRAGSGPRHRARVARAGEGAGGMLAQKGFHRALPSRMQRTLALSGTLPSRVREQSASCARSRDVRLRRGRAKGTSRLSRREDRRRAAASSRLRGYAASDRARHRAAEPSRGRGDAPSWNRLLFESVWNATACVSRIVRSETTPSADSRMNWKDRPNPRDEPSRPSTTSKVTAPRSDARSRRGQPRSP